MKQCVLFALFFAGISLFAQDVSKPPQIPYHVVEDFLKIPSDMIMEGAVAVDINSKGHIFILNRGNRPVLEFNPDGSFVTSFGEGSPIFRVPHSIRFDCEAHLWYVNAAVNL